MKSFISHLFTYGFHCFFLAPQKSDEKVDLVLLNTTIVDVQNDKLIEKPIHCHQRRYYFLNRAMEEIPVYDFKESLDLQGKYAMPGLWE